MWFQFRDFDGFGLLRLWLVVRLAWCLWFLGLGGIDFGERCWV